MLAVGAPSSGGGYGLTLGAQVFVLPIVALRVGGGFRQGQQVIVETLAFDSSTWMVAGSVAVHPLRSTRTQRFGIAARVDGILAFQTLTLPAAGGARKVARSPAIDAVGDASFLFLDDVEGVLGGGVEVGTGEDLFIRAPDGTRFDTVRIRGVGEAGIRIRF
jgi:hypothetical protein